MSSSGVKAGTWSITSLGEKSPVLHKIATAHTENFTVSSKNYVLYSVMRNGDSIYVRDLKN
jgi:hypothetical protein